jgi:deazaflavin-dependent oxidoreductase (nitroreductase family)
VGELLVVARPTPWGVLGVPPARPEAWLTSAGMDKRAFTTALAKYAVNPPVRALFRLGIPAPGTAILETTGRRSGQPRRTPVTDGRDGEVFWLVAEHGHRAAYVRNITANPRVRVKLGRRWREGTARVMPSDDPRRRLRRIAAERPLSLVNAATVLAMQSDLLSVRIDLDPAT